MRLTFFKTCALCALPSLAANIQRTIVIEMRDNMRFSPAHLTVKKGQTVRFIVKNVGMVKHEFNLGTAQQLTEHAKLMKKFPDMVHDDPNLVSVEPG